MNKLIIQIYRIFIIVFTSAAILGIAGIASIWGCNLFYDYHGTKITELPYLDWLFAFVIAEIVAIVFMIAKRGSRYFPIVEEYKSDEAIINFMIGFIRQGSSVTIVSNRAAWLVNNEDLIETINNKIKAGTKFDLIVKRIDNAEHRQNLIDIGVKLYIISDDSSPESRFTLINGDRRSAERLAIAKGSPPEHEITIFDSNSGPQMIGLARDLIRQYKKSAKIEK